jgi:D-3-phosphoglycerate dehydrogenase
MDEDALYRVLSGRKIAGAAIDVLETEPPRKDHPLLQLDNVILSPHIGGSTGEATDRGERGAAEEVVRVLQGQRPHHPVFDLRTSG